MNDELWLKEIKRQLDGYTEPLPPGGWEQLQQRISPRKAHVMHLSHRAFWAAAAVLVAAVSWMGLRWVQQEVVGATDLSMPMDEAMPVATLSEPSSLPVSTGGASATYTVRSRAERLAQADAVRNEGSVATVTVTLPAGEEEGKETEEPSRAETQGGEEVRTRPVRSLFSSDNHRRSATTSSSRHGGWSVGVEVGNVLSATSLLEQETGRQPLMDDMPDYAGRLQEGYAADLLKSPVPLRAEKCVSDARHKWPISVGAMVRKELGHGWAMETGLLYTYLESDIRYEGKATYVTQKLHYLGIPLRGSWTFVSQPRFSAYLSAGGAVEKCVSGRQDGAHYTVKPVQCSLTGAAGLQYHTSRHTSLYVEPGVAYYFDDGSSTVTIRKEHPFQFRLQAGFRLNY